MNFEIVQSLEEEIWHQFLNENPKANIFHTPEFFQVFGRVKGYKPHLWAAVNSGGQV